MTNQDLLYLYFSKSLSAEQEIVFKKLLETDAAFKAEFEYESSLKKAIKSHESDKLKAKLQDFERTINSQKSTSFNYTYLAVAASIVLMVGWFGYNAFFGTNYSNLYKANFSEYPNTVYTITRGNDVNTTEREAFVAYETQNFEIAIDKFNAISETTAQNYIPFYKAQAYLGLENTNEAKALLTQIVKGNNSSFVPESLWYLALIAIKEKDGKQAKIYLEELIANYSYNQAKAKLLLDKLN
ncbi:tol-pal system YbgF family protein [Bizionia sediminis]|uniref:Tol-pal system YbgF family protein n=1 Tax=Bizionia sediminis TaxID=1737064 RepID=A0ABW5KSG0_9FLAO